MWDITLLIVYVFNDSYQVATQDFPSVEECLRIGQEAVLFAQSAGYDVYMECSQGTTI